MNSKSFLEKVSKCSPATVKANNCRSGWKGSRHEVARDESGSASLEEEPAFYCKYKGLVKCVRQERSFY